MFEKATLGSVGFAEIETRLGAELTDRILDSRDPFIDQKLLAACNGDPLRLSPDAVALILDKSDEQMNRDDINTMYVEKYGRKAI